ncbi:hypothetical protein PAPYR_1146 [Paratrimastix pyriformis]|uniref:Uncharacterized protein n=1 Tax=Paratrimastix pyriformis TaxID=342808 RepID=A0ABQ8UTN2_9EUKA|nr:hypothetical protein PAPYR_1146 [Paratrimastix pyriformis]
MVENAACREKYLVDGEAYARMKEMMTRQAGVQRVHFGDVGKTEDCCAMMAREVRKKVSRRLECLCNPRTYHKGECELAAEMGILDVWTEREWKKAMINRRFITFLGMGITYHFSPYSFTRSPSHSHFIYSFSHPGHFQFISQLHISPPSIRVGASFPECTFLISPPTRAQGPSTLVAHHPVLTVQGHNLVQCII